MRKRHIDDETSLLTFPHLELTLYAPFPIQDDTLSPDGHGIDAGGREGFVERETLSLVRQVKQHALARSV